MSPRRAKPAPKRIHATIVEDAIEILRKEPGGMGFTPLAQRILARRQGYNWHTVYTIVAMLDKIRPDAIAKPERGWYTVAGTTRRPGPKRNPRTARLSAPRRTARRRS